MYLLTNKVNYQFIKLLSCLRSALQIAALDIPRTGGSSAVLVSYLVVSSFSPVFITNIFSPFLYTKIRA